MNHRLGFITVPDSINTNSLPQKHLSSSFFTFFFFELEEELPLPSLGAGVNLRKDIAGVKPKNWGFQAISNLNFRGLTKFYNFWLQHN
ncbi:hypothetical protein Ahy_B02g057987 [Arachis hypogaea]|uniref:Uncharacterized protein n=1 Tax=Arachis hypogaea TaxID=3818 RepID=A0A445ADI5_ARAHY|nr:hypothetical protein Ahy_B02g057987 [Arachis hypogaea]